MHFICCISKQLFFDSPHYSLHRPQVNLLGSCWFRNLRNSRRSPANLDVKDNDAVSRKLTQPRYKWRKYGLIVGCTSLALKRVTGDWLMMIPWMHEWKRRWSFRNGILSRWKYIQFVKNYRRSNSLSYFQSY